MAINPSYTLSFTILDRSAEIGRSSVNTGDFVEVDDGAGAIPASVQSLIDDFYGFLSVGNIVSFGSTATRKQSNASIGTGNREDRWLVRYQDTVTLKTYNFQVPARNNALVTVEGTDRLNLDNAINPGVTSAISALEAVAKSPDGNTIEVLDILLLGGR